MSKKVREVFDTESFITKGVVVHGDRFDYSKVLYKSAKTEVDIRCVKHDLWFKAQPYTHLNGKGSCPECRRGYSGVYNKLSLEDFIERAIVVHDNKYDYSLIEEYKNAHTKVPIVCDKHGVFYQTPSNHLYNGFGCNQCACINRGLESRLTQEEVISRFVERHGDKYDYSSVKYETIYEPIRIYCNKHLIWFEQTTNDHFHGTGCQICQREIKSTANLGKSRGLKTTEQFIESATEVHGDKYDYRLVEYTGIANQVKIVCREHGLFLQQASRHLEGRGCQVCGKIKASLNNRTTVSEFIERSVSVHGQTYDYSQVTFETLKDRVTIVCPKHGNFKQKASDHVFGKGCAKCSGAGGYRPNKEGYFYILSVDETTLKFGITGNIENRLRVLRDYSIYDLKLMHSFHSTDGKVPAKIESKVKQVILTGVVEKEDMYSGFSETTHISNLPIILQIVDEYKDQLS